jgi:hypothetical protein
MDSVEGDFVPEGTAPAVDKPASPIVARRSRASGARRLLRRRQGSVTGLLLSDLAATDQKRDACG